MTGRNENYLCTTVNRKHISINIAKYEHKVLLYFCILLTMYIIVYINFFLLRLKTDINLKSLSPHSGRLWLITADLDKVMKHRLPQDIILH